MKHSKMLLTQTELNTTYDINLTYIGDGSVVGDSLFIVVPTTVGVCSVLVLLYSPKCPF